MNAQRNNKGFTLTEMLIVLVIVGVLIGLVLISMDKAIERSQVTAVETQASSGDAALKTCFSAARNWGTCTKAYMLTERYLEVDPDINSQFGETYDVQAHTTGTGNVFCATNLPAGITFKMPAGC